MRLIRGTALYLMIAAAVLAIAAFVGVVAYGAQIEAPYVLPALAGLAAAAVAWRYFERRGQ